MLWLISCNMWWASDWNGVISGKTVNPLACLRGKYIVDEVKLGEHPGYFLLKYPQIRLISVFPNDCDSNMERWRVLLVLYHCFRTANFVWLVIHVALVLLVLRKPVLFRHFKFTKMLATLGTLKELFQILNWLCSCIHFTFMSINFFPRQFETEGINTKECSMKSWNFINKQFCICTVSSNYI